MRADLTVVQLQIMPRRKNKFAEHEEYVLAVITNRMHMVNTNPVLAIPQCLMSSVQGLQTPRVTTSRTFPLRADTNETS